MSPIDLIIRSGLDPKGFLAVNAAVDSTKGKAAQATQELNGMQRAIARAMDSFKAGIGIDVGARAVEGVFSIARAFENAIETGVGFNAMLEVQTVAFGTLLRSQDAAIERIRWLGKAAAETPFEFPEIVEASKILEAHTSGILAAGEGFTIIGNAAAALGKPLIEVANSIGRLYAGLQGGRPIGEALESLARMGLIAPEVRSKLERLAETGEATGRAFEVIKETFGRYNDGMLAQSKTFTGMASTLRDNWRLLAAEFTKPIFDGSKEQLASLIDLMESPEIKSATQNIIQQIDNITTAVTKAAQIIAQNPQLFGGNGLLGMIPGKTLAGIAGAGLFGQSATPIAGAAAIGELINLRELKTANEALAETIQQQLDLKRTEGTIDEEMIARMERQLKALRGINDERQRAKALASLNEALNPVQLPAVEVTAFDWDGHLKSLAEAEKRQRAMDEGLEVWRQEIDEKRAKEVEENVAMLEAAGEREKRSADAVNQYNLDELRKSLNKEAEELEAHLERMATQRALLDADFKMPEADKRQKGIELYEKEVRLLDEAIRKLKEKRDLETDPAAREVINERLRGLQSGRAGAERDAAVAKRSADPNSFSDQVALLIQFQTAAQAAAQAFANAFNSAINSISSGITGLIQGTMNWSDALRHIGTSILQSVVQEFVHMAVRMGMEAILFESIRTSASAGGAAARTAIRAGETVADVGQTGISVGAHTAGEGAKTGSTVAGSIGRGAARVAETVFSIVQTVASTAAHIAGEVAKTAVTIVQSAARIAANVTELLPMLLNTAFAAARAVASIPYIGPVLAIAAMASIIGAGVKYMGGFESGGYTGDGSPSDVAGVVHKREYVFSAPAVARIGRENLEGMASGKTGAKGGGEWRAKASAAILEATGGGAAGGRGGGGGNVTVLPAPVAMKMVVVDDEQKALRMLESEAGWKAIKRHMLTRGREIGLT